MSGIDEGAHVIDRLRAEQLEHFAELRELLERRRTPSLTQRDILAALLAAQTKQGSEHSSVKLTRNAKGDAQLEVIVRTGESAEIDTAAKAADEAVRIYNSLCELFPMFRGGASNE